jgi:hypothetical protein
LVSDLAFVGNFFTDDIPDGKCPSAFLSSVIPNFVAKAVGKKKHLSMVLQTAIARQKKSFPFEIYRQPYSVNDYVKYRRNKLSVTLLVSV